MPKRLQLSADERKVAAQFAQRLRLARLRRNLSQIEIAEQAGLSRTTYLKLEKGNPGASLAALMKVMGVLGYQERIGSLLESDPIGEDLEEFFGRKRASTRHDVESF